jgi:hypothetical protein
MVDFRGNCHCHDRHVTATMNVSDRSVPFRSKKGNDQLLHDVNGKLQEYLGSADHRSRMAKYGITKTEIDGVIG